MPISSRFSSSADGRLQKLPSLPRLGNEPAHEELVEVLDGAGGGVDEAVHAESAYAVRMHAPPAALMRCSAFFVKYRAFTMTSAGDARLFPASSQKTKVK